MFTFVLSRQHKELLLYFYEMSFVINFKGKKDCRQKGQGVHRNYAVDELFCEDKNINFFMMNWKIV